MFSKKLFSVPLLLSTTLILAACGGSSDSSPPTQEANAVSISGKAAKGLIIGGVVTAYPIIDGVVDFEAALGTAITDESGAYTIDIADHDGGPVIVRVAPAEDGSTSMRCDLSDCGDGVAFGDDVDITDAAFTLDAVVDTADDETISVNITVLTDTAAEVTIDALDSASDTSAGAVAQLISDSNSSVANRFGIVGDIAELPIVDLTNPVDVAAADQDAIEYSLLSAAIVEAVISNNAELSIEEAVQSFAADFVENGGVADTEEGSTATVTLTEILTEAASIIEAIEQADESGELDLGSLETEIEANANAAEQGSTEPSDGVPDEGSVSELAAVKTMVQEMRNLGTGVLLDNTEAFGDELDLAAETFDADAGYVVEAMGLASGAIALAWEAYSDDDTLTSYIDDDSGITVSIASGDNGTTLTVDSDVTVESDDGVSGVVVAVDLTGTDANSEINTVEADPVENSDGSVTEDFDADATVSLSLLGTSESDTVLLTITEGTVSVELVVDAADTNGVPGTGSDGERLDTEPDTLDVTVAALDFDLEITLEENADSVSNPITFTGGFEFSLTALDVDIEESSTRVYAADTDAFLGYIETWDESVSVGEVSFGVSGEFSSAAGQSVSASLAVNADGTGVTFVCTGEEENLFAIGSYSSSDVCTDETENAYVDIDFALVLSLDVAGVANDISVTLSGDRTGLEDGVLSVDISYGAVMFDVDYDSQDSTENTETITIENQSGIVVTLVETDVDGETNISGTIVLNGTEYATISDELGFLAVSYSDGSNTSF